MLNLDLYYITLWLLWSAGEEQRGFFFVISCLQTLHPFFGTDTHAHAG